MARLIPLTDISAIEVKPERDVARSLVDGLPDDCLVYHSYPWLRPERHDRGGEGRLREGEADFVIVHPEFGLLVLEVKGGQIEYDPASHTWWRRLSGGERREITNPFRQAQRNLHALVDQIQEHGFGGRDSLPCTYGYAVIFPDCESTGVPPPGAASGVLLTSKELAFLGRRCPEILKKWSRGPRRVMTAHEMARIREGLSPTFRLVSVLSRQVASQEEALVRLTDRQQDALEGLYANDRVLVQGTAGSGKTMLALIRARRFAEQRKKTLFLCYNRGLAEWLESLVPDQLRPFLAVRHFHKLCSEWCWQAGIPFKADAEDERDFWREKAADLLDRAIDRIATRYEALVVDEGQDFFPDWWMPIELLNASAEAGPLYIFYDPAQNLYVDQPLVFPHCPVRYSLPTNCRNTREIARACGTVIGIEIPVRQDAPEGVKPCVVVSATPDGRRALVEQQIHEWVGKGKLRPGQVAIVSPNKQAKSCLAGVESLRGVPLVTNLADWNEGKGILCTTVRAFKGLEADALLVADVGPFSSVLTRSDLYVACSRAKHLLTCVASEPIAL